MRLSFPKNLCHLHPAVISIILLSLFFETYLAITSHPLIVLDSIGYQNLGQLILQGPWQEYFRTGPSREPLFPLLIALSMRIAQSVQVDYMAVQVAFQVGLITLTQLLTAKLLKRLQIADSIAAVAVAYLAFSPVMLNSAFILYSEIATYPLILALVMAAASAWQDLPTAPWPRLGRHAFGMALAGLLITFTKGIFEIIVPVLLLPYLVRLVFTRTAWERVRLCAFVGMVFLAFQIPLIMYKNLNKTYNGVYTVTDRGAIALYGNTARRMLPLDFNRFKTAIAYTAGEDVCFHLYGKDCDAWGFLPVDILGSKENAMLLDERLDRQTMNDRAIQDSVKEALRNPPQYVLLTVVEGLKIFFWEGAEIFCVVFPQKIMEFYSNLSLRWTLRFLWGGLSILGLYYGIFRIIRDRARLLNGSQPSATLLMILVLLTAYVALYSIFYITSRYTLPVVPLFLALGSLAVNDLVSKKKT